MQVLLNSDHTYLPEQFEGGNKPRAGSSSLTAHLLRSHAVTVLYFCMHVYPREVYILQDGAKTNLGNKISTECLII